MPGVENCPLQQLAELAIPVVSQVCESPQYEVPRTLVTVQVGKASTLASKSDPIGIEGSLERIGATGGEINSAFRYVATRRRRAESNGDTETIDKRDIVEVAASRLTQGKFGESDRRNTLFPKSDARPGSILSVKQGEGCEAYRLPTLQAADTRSEITGLSFGLAEIAVASAPDATGGPIVWDIECSGRLTRSFPSEKKTRQLRSQRGVIIRTQW